MVSLLSFVMVFGFWFLVFGFWFCDFGLSRFLLYCQTLHNKMIKYLPLIAFIINIVSTANGKCCMLFDILGAEPGICNKHLRCLMSFLVSFVWHLLNWASSFRAACSNNHFSTTIRFWTILNIFEQSLWFGQQPKSQTTNSKQQ